MNEQGLWKLFMATGSPKLYLAIRQREQLQVQQLPAKTAFRPAAPATKRV